MTRTKKKTQGRRKKTQAPRSKTRRAPSSNDLRLAALLSFEHFKRVFSHPSVDFERTVSLFGLAETSALLMACQSDGRDTIAKARWLVDHGASVCKLLEYTDILGDWRVGVAATGVGGLEARQVVAALERLFRKHCAMVVRLIGLKTDVPLLPLALEQEVASFLV